MHQKIVKIRSTTDVIDTHDTCNISQQGAFSKMSNNIFSRNLKKIYQLDFKYWISSASGNILLFLHEKQTEKNLKKEGQSQNAPAFRDAQMALPKRWEQQNGSSVEPVPQCLMLLILLFQLVSVTLTLQLHALFYHTLKQLNRYSYWLRTVTGSVSKM